MTTVRPRLRVRCAGGIVHDPAGRLLLVRRARPPAAGSWSVPGGRCLDGESAVRACVRELSEETGLRVRVTSPAGRVERDAPDGSLFVIDDFVCAAVGGRLRAADDASDARWFDAAGLRALDVAPGVLTALARWGLLPRR